MIDASSLNFREIFITLRDKLLEQPPVEVGEWQSQQVSTPMRELLHVVFEWPMPERPINLGIETGARLPWAEDHSKERLGGLPLNPAPSHGWWPFNQQGNKAHMPTVEKEVDERYWAYLAAFIDADGAITFPKAENKVHPRIRISQNDKAALRFIASIFGVGTLSERSPRQLRAPVSGKIGYADQLIWQIQSVKEVEWVLKHTLPYYQEKKHKAKKALDYIQNTLFNTRKEVPREVRFSHTYPERLWPKYAAGADVPRKGIRFEYGDLNDVVNQLSKSPNTRQAYLPLWFPEDTGAVHGERVPCTLGYHFIIRDGVLDISYFMRSTDLLRHFQDDVYLAVRLAQWVVDQLRDDHPHRPLRVGKLIFHTANLHIFDSDVDMLNLWATQGKTWF